MHPESVQDATSFAPPRRSYGGSAALTAAEPAWRIVPASSAGSELTALRPRIFGWIEEYYDRDHLTRAGDWMLVLAPERPELAVAALLHDMERSVPGGPKLEMATTPWDDRAYNDAHTGRSAEIVPAWLAEQGAPAELCAAVAQPIREHEFGGSPDGDLMQACDSISFLEANVELVASWANRGMCTVEKARQKLEWMGDRVRHERGREIVAAYKYRALDEFQAQLTAPER
jgi:hypothetical protein